MLLQQVLEGIQRTKFVLIQDSKDESGAFLLTEFIKANIKRNKVYLFCFENNSFTSQNFLQDYERKNIKLFDFVSDPKGWLEEGKTTLPSNINIFNELRSSLLSDDKHPVIIIDSLSSALVSIDLKLLYRQIHQLMYLPLGKDVISLQVIAVIHKDYLVDGEIALLEFKHLATSIINVENCGKFGLDVLTTLRKLNGKVINERNSICLDSSGQLVIKEIKDVNQDKNITGRDTTKDITENLTTFKLDLRAQEKEARNKLLLPYLKTEEQSTGGGNIYYEPDASDDWDEEDPDDDLDI